MDLPKNSFFMKENKTTHDEKTLPKVNMMVHLVPVLINQYVPSFLQTLLHKSLEREKAAQKVFSIGFLELITPD